MTPHAPQQAGVATELLPWYVYDRNAALLHIAETLELAEDWAIQHWGVVEVAGREQVEPYDYWYLLLAEATESHYQSRDFQARIMRADRVQAIGQDPMAQPRCP